MGVYPEGTREGMRDIKLFIGDLIEMVQPLPVVMSVSEIGEHVGPEESHVG